VSLLHYAGHATFGGPDGVDSALPLANGASLTPGDVLALASAPAHVALFGCDTGRESANGTLDALGLANAFLAAGASDVLATSRVVDDRLARDLAARYYARLLESSVLDPPAALRDALLAVRRDDPGSDWAAFRALVR
jgi:CHAT domain-containing protein